MILGIMMRYMKLSNCGTAGTQGTFDDDVEIAATIVLVDTKRRWGGSIPGHKTYKRDREVANKLLNAQYFVDRPLYNADHFRRRCVLDMKHKFYCTVNEIYNEQYKLCGRYRMRESLFLSIVDKVIEGDSYFKQKRNCAG